MESVSLLHKSREKEFKATVNPEVSEKISHVDFSEVSRLEFIASMSLKSLLWALAFFIFFLDICLRRNPDNWFFSSIAALAAGFGILALIVADRQHYIVLFMNDGTKNKIEIAKDNSKDAEAFVAMVNKEIT